MDPNQAVGGGIGPRENVALVGACISSLVGIYGTHSRLKTSF
jgi:hypothetical protein